MCGLPCMYYDVRFEQDGPDQDEVPMCADKHTVAGQSLVRSGMGRTDWNMAGDLRQIGTLGQSAPDSRCTWQGADQHWRSTQKTIPYSNLLLVLVLWYTIVPGIFLWNAISLLKNRSDSPRCAH